MPFGRMRRIGNCPPRLRAGLGGAGEERDMLSVSTAERPLSCTHVVHCPLPPSRGFSRSRRSRRCGRWRRRPGRSIGIRNCRSGSSGDSAAVHSCWLLLGYFYPGFCGTSVQGVPRCCCGPTTWRGPGSRSRRQRVFPIPSSDSWSRRRSSVSTCLPVLYPFPIFCQVFLYRKRTKCYSQLIIPLNKAVLLRLPLSYEPPNRRSQ